MSYAQKVIEERDALRAELKNFLSAFDGYFELRGIFPSPQKVDDAKKAMFSAATQARELLGNEDKPTPDYTYAVKPPRFSDFRLLFAHPTHLPQGVDFGTLLRVGAVDFQKGEVFLREERK